MKLVKGMVWMVLILFFSSNTIVVSDTNYDIGTSNQEMKGVLDEVMSEIASGLEKLDTENARSAQGLADIDLNGSEAARILNKKLNATPYGHSSLIITADGKVSAAAPEIYSGLVGEDFGYQPEVIYANSEKKPVISNVFLLKEGFYGISQSYPIFSSQKEYRGYTDITYRPEEFLSQFIIPITEQTRYDFFILQPDGVTIYETNAEETGKNVLTDPLYQDPEMHHTAEVVTTNESGEITYTFWNREWNSKEPRLAVWDTLEYGTQKWRVAIVRSLKETDEGETGAKTDAAPQNSSTVNESISALGFPMGETKFYAPEYTKKEAVSHKNDVPSVFVYG